MQETIMLDGVEVSVEEFNAKLQEAKSNPNILIKEVSSGQFKTLERLQG